MNRVLTWVRDPDNMLIMSIVLVNMAILLEHHRIRRLEVDFGRFLDAFQESSATEVPLFETSVYRKEMGERDAKVEKAAIEGA